MSIANLDDLFGFTDARKRAQNQVLPSTFFIKHRVFINHVDSFNSKNFAAYLADKVYGASRIPVEGLGEEEPEEEPVRESKLDIPNDMSKVKYELIGTLCQSFSKKSEDILFTIEENSPTFMEEVKKCGFIIYDITKDKNEIPKAIQTLTDIAQYLQDISDEGPKTYMNLEEIRVFILISTIMTWAKTKPLDPDDPDLAFSEIDYKKRKSHPNYKEHIACEKEVILKGRKFKDKLKTYVICSGIIYGLEEEDLEFLFRMAWYHENYLPVFKNGKNKVPFIHIKDFSKVVHGLMEMSPTKPQYILAVEQLPCTLKQVVKSLSKALGSGKTKDISEEEAFLHESVNQQVFERCTVNLNMEPVFIVDSLQIQWQNEMNLAENMKKIVAEYRESRKLSSIKVLVHGPPASGRTTLAKWLSGQYGLHYVSIKTMIEETLKDLKENIEGVRERIRLKEEKDKYQDVNLEEDEEENVEEEEDDVNLLEGWEEQVKEIQTNLENGSGRLTDDYVNGMMKKFLAKNICQNRGFVLDGYPKTVEQTKALFAGGVDGFGDEAMGEEEQEDEDGRNRLLPEFVISLEAPDEYLCERVASLPEQEVQGTNFSEENMVRRLAEFRLRNTEDTTLLNFFDENEIHPILIDITKYMKEDIQKFQDCIRTYIGPPVGFTLTLEEEKELRRIEEEQQKLEKEKEKLSAELIEAEAAQNYYEKVERWTATLEGLQMEEEKILVLKSKPLRQYLMQYVFPTLTAGLIELVKVTPDDPVDFLAEYLFKENPEGKMFDPSYSQKGETLLEHFETEIQEIIDKITQDALEIEQMRTMSSAKI